MTKTNSVKENKTKMVLRNSTNNKIKSSRTQNMPIIDVDNQTLSSSSNELPPLPFPNLFLNEKKNAFSGRYSENIEEQYSKFTENEKQKYCENINMVRSVSNRTFDDEYVKYLDILLEECRKSIIIASNGGRYVAHLLFDDYKSDYNNRFGSIYKKSDDRRNVIRFLKSRLHKDFIVIDKNDILNPFLTKMEHDKSNTFNFYNSYANHIIICWK